MKTYIKQPALLPEVGSSLLLEISGCGNGTKGYLVGYKQPEYMIIEIQTLAGLESKLAEGTPMAGAFLHSGSIARFQSLVLGYTKKPARLIFASFPTFLGRHELRKFQRIECNIPSVLKLCSPALEYKGLIVDLGGGGCRFSTSVIPKHLCEMLEKTYAVELVFELQGIPGEQNISGQIVDAERHGKKTILRVEFSKKNALHVIDNYVRSILELI